MQKKGGAMNARRVFFLFLGLAVLFSFSLEAGEPKKKRKKKDPKKVRWVAINYKQFDVDPEIGALTSCAYRMCPKGEAVPLIWKDRIKVVVLKDEKDELHVAMYVSKEVLASVTRELVRSGLESAVSLCYEKMTEDDTEEEEKSE